MKRHTQRWGTALAAASMMAAVLAVASPANAEAPIGGLHDERIIGGDDTGPVTDTGAGTDGGSGTPDQNPADPLIAEPEPIANTGAAEYDTVWSSDGVVPVEIVTIRSDDNVQVWTHAPDDRSAFMALLIIENADAPTEYRFEQAVPQGHTAAVHDDGSVRFYDADGNESGGVMAPWAIDADGRDVATSYRLEGDTIVQTVEHQDASYPVVADPVWIPVGVAIAIGACVTNPLCLTAVIELPRVAPTAVGVAWRNRGALSSGDGNAPGQRATNTCNSRNRAGC